MSKDYDDFKERYQQKIEQELNDESSTTTEDYHSFKQSMQPPSLSFYEKACNWCENLIEVEPGQDKLPEIQEALRIGHLNITPTATMSFAVVTTLATMAAFLLTGLLLNSTFVMLFGLVFGGIMLIPLTKLPFIIANTWKMKASNQMVLCVFYVVTFLRHTSNLELAINFAAKHLGPPLSIDLRKVLWDVENGRYDTIGESLDDYLETWRDDNPEFIESMHLVESSLHESSEGRREDALDKALDVILDETYEKMLHFTHDLKGPINMLHMLGIILPILGLIILPMLTSFIPETRWYHIGLVYNILLPLVVYYLAKQILSTRPTGYGGVDVSGIELEEDDNGEVEIDVGRSETKPTFTPFVTGLTIFGILTTFALIPFFLGLVNPTFDIHLTQDLQLTRFIDDDTIPIASFLDYQDQTPDSPGGPYRGPYGLGSTLLSIFFPLGLGLGLGTYYKMKSEQYIDLREKTKELEEEFSSALFQLGNRLGDGLPAEIAFSKVADVMQDTRSGDFFRKVNNNIARMGMNVRSAIFDSDVGAIKDFPSTIIESSMNVFIQSIKKGPMVASKALLGVAEYIKSMHRVDERLKDLLADILSSMQTQAKVLTPAISGVVVGITSLISQLLKALSQNLDQLNTGGGTGGVAGGAGGVAGGGGMLTFLQGGGVPNYYFQGVVGLYVIQITIILSLMINGIKNGKDDTYRMYLLGQNLTLSTAIYTVLAIGFTIGFSFISANIVTSLSG
jgi:hypothetical protein